MQSEWTGPHVCGSKCPPSKWQSRTTEDWDPAGPNSDLTVPGQPTVADHQHCEFVAARDANAMRRIMSRTSSTATMEAFGKTRVMTHSKHWHHFGCPAYALDGALQGGAGIFHKLLHNGYLGRSPQHARLVAWYSTSPRVMSCNSST